MNKKIFYKGIGMVVLGSILLFSTACTSSVKAQEVKNEQMHKIEIAQEDYKIDEKYIKGTLKIPVVKNIVNEEAQDRMNTLFKNELMEFADMQMNFARNSQDEKESSTIIGSEYELTYQTDNMISIIIKEEVNQGKEDGYVLKYPYTIDLNTGKQIEMYRLFDEKEDYEKVIKDYIYNKYKDQYYITKDAIMDSSYYLKGKNIGICFEPYSIGSSENEKCIFEIPFDAFKKGVNTNISLKAQAVKVSTKNMKEDNEYIVSNINMPIISGLKNEKIQQKINKMFEKDILDFKNMMIQSAKEGYEDAKKYEYEMHPYSADVFFTEKKNEENILSVYVVYYSYTGGAHGGHDDITYNIDLRTGDVMNLKDLFKDGYDYKKIISEKVRKQMDQINQEEKERLIKEGEDPQNIYTRYEGFHEIRDDQSYYLKDGRVGIYFGLYEIGSYAEGIPTFEIPISELKEGINEKYLKDFE
ncbi:DUF3298 and DUF4163 domain-containing protein [Inediibacterium massiliense]|uniref:DUF3298 and DUF4163 domain-containing protein n=1 Tax=Inediibacterium massiliense TaxID=1658111 RepID=UPI0006B54270|nr:DUF3298 and DUF4163 domain-containing protein [Inediibacterium massiliense]